MRSMIRFLLPLTILALCLTGCGTVQDEEETNGQPDENTEPGFPDEPGEEDPGEEDPGDDPPGCEEPIDEPEDDAPIVCIDSGPEALTNATTAELEFSCNEPCATQCRLDDADYVFCDSPMTYTDLDDGEHVFLVRALGESGEPGEEAQWAWTVDTVQPEVDILEGPEEVTDETQAVFALECSKDECSFFCGLNSASGGSVEEEEPCSSGVEYLDLSDDGYTFTVTAIDPAGNESDPAEWSWVVDTTPPPVSCSNNDDCEEDEFCRRKHGHCEETGYCDEKPLICTPAIDPVCGCDGETYDSECEAAKEGVSVDRRGPCEADDACKSHAECARSEFCKKADGDCDGDGVCKPRPQHCPPVYEPVCGCDGQGHSNRCDANAAGTSIDHEGSFCG